VVTVAVKRSLGVVAAVAMVIAILAVDVLLAMVLTIGGALLVARPRLVSERLRRGSTWSANVGCITWATSPLAVALIGLSWLAVIVWSLTPMQIVATVGLAAILAVGPLLFVWIWRDMAQRQRPVWLRVLVLASAVTPLTFVTFWIFPWDLKRHPHDPPLSRRQFLLQRFPTERRGQSVTVEPPGSSEGELRAWATSGDPEPIDWDVILAADADGAVLVRLIEGRIKPEFFLRVLYLVTGDAVRTERSDLRERLKTILEVARRSGDPWIRAWVQRTEVLLANPETFDYTAWCDGGLARHPSGA
jgi:hypothetical protein